MHHEREDILTSYIPEVYCEVHYLDYMLDIVPGPSLSGAE